MLPYSCTHAYALINGVQARAATQKEASVYHQCVQAKQMATSNVVLWYNVHRCLHVVFDVVLSFWAKPLLHLLLLKSCLLVDFIELKKRGENGLVPEVISAKGSCHSPVL